jgi:hypothetical protein
LDISGGLFDVEGSAGTVYGLNSGGGAAILDFQAGRGVFDESNSDTFSRSVQVRFDFQSSGSFELASATSTPFDSLAASGDLYYQETSGGAYTQLDNTPTDPNYYQKYLSATNSGGTTETLTVTSVVPEPST